MKRIVLPLLFATGVASAVEKLPEWTYFEWTDPTYDAPSATGYLSVDAKLLVSNRGLDLDRGKPALYVRCAQGETPEVYILWPREEIINYVTTSIDRQSPEVQKWRTFDAAPHIIDHKAPIGFLREMLGKKELAVRVTSELDWSRLTAIFDISELDKKFELIRHVCGL